MLDTIDDSNVEVETLDVLDAPDFDFDCDVVGSACIDAPASY